MKLRTTFLGLLILLFSSINAQKVFVRGKVTYLPQREVRVAIEPSFNNAYKGNALAKTATSSNGEFLLEFEINKPQPILIALDTQIMQLWVTPNSSLILLSNKLNEMRFAGNDARYNTFLFENNLTSLHDNIIDDNNTNIVSLYEERLEGLERNFTNYNQPDFYNFAKLEIESRYILKANNQLAIKSDYILNSMKENISQSFSYKNLIISALKENVVSKAMEKLTLEELWHQVYEEAQTLTINDPNLNEWLLAEIIAAMSQEIQNQVTLTKIFNLYQNKLPNSPYNFALLQVILALAGKG